MSADPCPWCLEAFLSFSHKRGQRQRISAILDAEDAQQEAVEKEKNTSPSQDSHLLLTRFGDPWNRVGQSYNTNGEKPVYKPG